MKLLFTSVTKQAALMRRATVLSLPFKLVFPGLMLPAISPQAWIEFPTLEMVVYK